MLFHYLKIALRHILEDKLQSTISMVGIAFGIFCFCLTLYCMNLFDDGYSDFPHYADLAELRIAGQGSSYTEDMIPGKLVETLENNPVMGIEKVASYLFWNDANITFSKNDTETVPFLCRIALVNADFFDVFSCRPVNGSKTLKPGEAIISEACAQKVFGKQNPVGRQLCFTPVGGDMQKAGFSKIVGVIRDLSQGSPMQSDVYLPSAQERTKVMVLLANRVPEREINERLSRMNLLPGQPEKEIKVVRVSSILLSTEELAMKTLVLFVASLVLIAGLINFLKNCIYSFYSRTQELSLRKELGAGRLSLWSMLFLEIMMVLLGAAIISICLSELIVPRLYLFLPPAITALLSPDLPALIVRQVWMVALLCIGCALIAWIAIVRMKRWSVIRGLRGTGSARQGKHAVRNFMVGFQIFICILFIGGTLGFHFVYRNIEQNSYYPLSREELDGIWTFSLQEPQLQGRHDEIESQLKQLGGVKDILRTSYWYTVPYEMTQGYRMYGLVVRAGKNYFSFYNIPVHGSLPDNEQKIAVPRSFMEILQTDTTRINPVLGDKSFQVSGYFERVPFQVERKRTFTVVSFSGQGNHFYVKCVPGKEKEVQEQIRQIIRRYLPDTIPFRMMSLEEEIYETSKGWFDQLRNLFAILSVITIVITVMGIYSTITVDSLSRQKEVAIRKVNGAGRRDIVYLFGKLYLRLWLIAGLIAFPALFLLTRAFSGDLAGYTAHFNRPWFWLAVFGISALLVFVTVAYRIGKISELNPALMVRKDG